MKILISGLGIAGPTLAWWLKHYGFETVVVERASAPRDGGFVIDFWGAGYEIADHMHVLEELKARAYAVNEVRMVDAAGTKRGGFPAEVFTRCTKGRYLSLPRGDLSLTLHYAIDGHTEKIFGDRIQNLEQDGAGVEVEFAHSASRRFDLVIGADGIDSGTRSLVFGPREHFERFLGYKFAAFILPHYANRNPGVYLSHNEAGRQVARFSLRDGSTLVLLVFADEDTANLPHERCAQLALLRDRFSRVGWEAPAILESLDAADDIYLDRVSQIRMERWSKGRVALVGDAACAPSFLAGQGSALAMVGAYVLAGELAAAEGDYARAFAGYEKRLHAFMLEKQRAAENFAGSFAPKSQIGVLVRDYFSRTLRIPVLAKWALRGLLRDKIELPRYRVGTVSSLP